MPDLEVTTAGPQPQRIQHEIAILGGGFAGVYCGQKLAKKLKTANLPAESAVIVSDQNYMVFQPMLAEVAGASISPRHIVNPIRLLCRGMNVLRGQVENIDIEKKEILINTGHFSAGIIIEFNHLVLALGAEIDLSRVPGMPEHAFLMQNVGDAMVLRATIISRIEEANAEYRPEVRARLLTFVVVGGGYSGVETAGEILDLLHEIAKFYNNVTVEDIRVVLVHSRERILHTLSDSLGDYAGRKLMERGLEIRFEERVLAMTATKVYLKSGEVIESSTVVSTVGTAPSKAIAALCERADIPNDRSYVKTDECLRVIGHDFLWAAGDCASVPLNDGGGARCPQTAQFAMRQGERLAENLVSHLRGAKLRPFLFKGLGELASIGHRTAVANIMGMQFSGIIAWFMWRTIYLSKLPGIDRRLRVTIDWTLDLFFPRDINLLSPRYTKLFQQVHLEPNDKLFHRGEPAFSLYVVKTGQIDLVDENGVAVRSVEKGDFFGERALVYGGGYIYDAVSQGPSELVSISGDVVMPFLQTSRRFRRVLAKTTAQESAEAELTSILAKLNPAVLAKQASEVMRADVATLRLDETIGDAIELFKTRRFSIYPLIDSEGKLTGVLSREDFFDCIKREGTDAGTTLDKIDLMHLPTCRANASVKDLLEKMIRYGRHKCLVTNADNKLVGILTVMDLLGESAEQEI